MNCDRAFDLMTSLATKDSAELRSHLLDCPRCRTMREALSPAMSSLADDLVTPDDWSGDADAAPHTPTWSGAPWLTPLAHKLAPATAGELLRRSPTHRTEVVQRWLAAAMLSIFGFGLGIALADRPPNRTMSLAPSSATPQMIAECLWQARNATRSAGLMAQTTFTAASSNAVVATCVSCHVPAGG